MLHSAQAIPQKQVDTTILAEVARPDRGSNRSVASCERTSAMKRAGIESCRRRTNCGREH